MKNEVERPRHSGRGAITDHSDLIERLRAACVGYPRASIAWPHRILHEAADALSSQSLSLSEAREEIERLKKERDAIRQEAHEVVLSMIFMPGVREALDALPEDDPVEPYIARIRELEAKEARLAALENSPAGLADATSNPPLADLSSLRKGAEVEKARQAVERLANVQMNISLEEWAELSSAILSALVSGSREDGE